MLSTEHRAAPASPPVYLELVTTDPEATHLDVIAELRDENRRSLEQQVSALVAKDAVLTRAKLRDALSVKNERLGEVLESLERAGQIRRTPAGWQRIDGPRAGPFPVPHIERWNGNAASSTEQSPTTETM